MTPDTTRQAGEVQGHIVLEGNLEGIRVPRGDFCLEPQTRMNGCGIEIDGQQQGDHGSKPPVAGEKVAGGGFLGWAGEGACLQWAVH